VLRRFPVKRVGLGKLWLTARKPAKSRLSLHFQDFNVYSERKRLGKLRYMHRNPVKRGLVIEPGQWKWSSFRAYSSGERGLVRVTYQEWPLRTKACPVQRFGDGSTKHPLIRKVRE